MFIIDLVDGCMVWIGFGVVIENMELFCIWICSGVVRLFGDWFDV